MMADFKIKLTIQEIIEDFETLIRYDERLVVHFDFMKADDETIAGFYGEMKSLIEKYIPNYQEHVSEKYFSDEASDYEKALLLYGMLYENFKEMFYKMI